MKKLTTLTLALFLSAGMAFAQNSANTSSNGANNAASVVQTGDLNSADISQTGDEHDAQIKQNGDDNETLISQDGYSHKGVQTMASGNGNFTSVNQSGGDAGLASGGNSLTRIELWGDDNEVMVDQAGDNQRIFVELQENAPNSGNFVDLSQSGADNQAQINIDGHDNSVTGDQSGSNNTIGAVYGTVGVEIDGDGNEASVRQNGDLNSTLFVIEGNDNKAVERMTNGSNNVVTIDQLGDGNRAVYEIWGDDNTIDIDQSGNDHTVFINGRGTSPAPGGGVTDNNVDIDQYGGDGNTAEGYFANDSELNFVTIDQNGSGNQLVGSLGPNGNAGFYIQGVGNTLDVMQSGTNNVASASATGTGNTSTVTQTN